MNDKAKFGAGNVDIELDGQKCTLKPTLRAARLISRQFGGFQKALEAIGGMDLDAYISVVTAGLSAKPEDADDIANAVYRNGLPSLTEPVIQYVMALANGGRPLSGAGGSGEENPQDSKATTSS